jgi:Flp pilus assembly protein TadG
MTRRSGKSERGAALVEMAVVLPLFVLLVFGLMDAAWAFAQLNDAHHGVREGARLAAVNYDPDDDTATNDVFTEMCDRMSLAGDDATVTLSIISNNADGEFARGATGNAAVTVQYQSLTGILGFVWGSSPTLSSDANFLLEQPVDGDATWPTGPTACVP